MGRSKDRPSVAKNKYYKLTSKQLNSWKVKFHKLHFGKISYDLLVDDKALFFNKNWSTNLMKKLEVKSQMSKGENRKYK